MAKIESSKDLIMLLLCARGHTGKLNEPIEGKTRLMKMVFLFDKEIRKNFNVGNKIKDEAFPNFEPYTYGPFSAQVYEDLEFLVDLGLISVTSKKASDKEGIPDMEEYKYWQANSGDTATTDYLEGTEIFQLTRLGKQFLEENELNDLSLEQREVLNKFKTRCTGIPLTVLLRYVYNKYPETTTNSEILKKILS